MIRIALIAAAIVAAPAQAQEGGTVVRQTRVPIEQVLGREIKPTDAERDGIKEVRRHNEAIEKELRRMRKGKDNPFALPQGRQRQPRTVRTLPANANSY